MFASATPITWATIPEIIVVIAIVFAVGWQLKRAIGRGSETRRIHGEYVFWWTTGGYAAGWLIALLISVDNEGGMSGAAGFCLLIGWMIGMVHGGLVLATRRADSANDRENGDTPKIQTGRIAFIQSEPRQTVGGGCRPRPG